jgi:AraC-like DNA-binding protein
MSSFETGLRLVVVGQALLIAAVFLFGRGRLSARLSGTLLLVSVAAYLLESDPVLSDSLAGLVPALGLLSILIPYALWSFARSVFEAPWPNRWVVVTFVALASVFWVLSLIEESAPRWLEVVVERLRYLASLVMVGHALLMAARGRPDDLIERRRLFRVFFIVIVAIQVGIVMGVELFIGELQTGWLTLTNVTVIAILTFGLAVPLLRLDRDFFPRTPAPASGLGDGEEEELSPAEAVLKKALLALMDDGTYRRSGLTISALAADLGHPEHRLRQLINGRLGYRNFSAFLNSYRIPEAQQVLSDPERVRKPVLSIALDLGYGSLGPFNRAFKSATGQTPTEYRQRALGSASADSE